MNKKLFPATILLITCFMLLIVSYSNWKDKITSYNDTTKIEKTISKDTATEEKSTKTNEVVADSPNLLVLTTNQDEAVQAIFADRFNKKEKANFLIVGSDLMLDGNPGYAELLKNALTESYGEQIQVTTLDFDMTSQEFIEEQIDLSVGYDIVLMEPFTLRNNGVVTVEDEHAHIEAFSTKLKEQVEDAVVILNPANPIYAANYYPSQISALKDFASLNSIPYIDHWQNWPDKDSEDIKQFLDDESAPNSEGAKVWADALITYFVAQ